MKETPFRYKKKLPLDRMQKKPAFQCAVRSMLALSISICFASCSTLRADERDTQPTALQDQIWPPFPPLKRVMSQKNQHYAEAGLVRWVEACSDFKYEVIDEDYLWLRPESKEWAALAKSHWNRIGADEWAATEIEIDCDVSGYNPIIFWKIVFEGKPRFFAITMTSVPVPGSGHRRLFARFELKIIRNE